MEKSTWQIYCTLGLLHLIALNASLGFGTRGFGARDVGLEVLGFGPQDPKL